MKIKAREIRKAILLVGFLFLLIPALAFSQEYPTKPINLLISFAAGGPMDIPARQLLKRAEEFLGQAIAVSNNGAGGGSVGVGMVAKQKPDGYHLLGCTTTGLVRIPQFRDVPYKLEDFIPIMSFGAPCSGLFVKADAPWKTLKEFVEYAKKNPGKVTYASLGQGTPFHFAMEVIARQEGIQWKGIPYPGDAAQLPALLGGHVHASSASGSSIIQVKQGALRLLASHSERRLKSFPDVPTFRELGYDFINETVYIIATPKGTPPPIVKKLEDAFRRAMDDPEFLKIMDQQEFEVFYRNSEDLKRYLDEAYVRLGKMIIEFKVPKEGEKK